MSGPKRNPDKLNTIGVIVVGVCGAVLVYVTIVALQAFYMNDTSEVQTMADYGGQDTTYKSIRTTQISNISEYGPNAAAPGQPQTYRVSIDRAIKLVVDAAKVDPANLVPTQGRADKPTVVPVFGRPKVTPASAPAGGAAPPPAPPTPGTESAPMTPTGGLGQGGGAPPGTQGEVLTNPGANQPQAGKAPATSPPAAPPAGPAKTPATGTAPPKAPAATPPKAPAATPPKAPATAPKAPAATPKAPAATPKAPAPPKAPATAPSTPATTPPKKGNAP
jgi:hypothetical protein